MKSEFHVTGSERKRLVSVIAKAADESARYLGLPSMAYEIGPFTVSQDGTLEFSDNTDSETVEAVYEAVDEAGFICDELEADPAPDVACDPTPDEAREASAPDKAREASTPDEAGDGPAPNVIESAADTDGVVVALPLAGFNPDSLDRLQKLIDSKASLIKKALGADTLTVRIRADRVEFPWFEHVPAPEMIRAATAFIAALCKQAKGCSRVTAIDHPVESEKYAFRTFLLRLGFSGQENKDLRAALMKNLSGPAAFPSNEAAVAFAAAQKAKREAAKGRKDMDDESNAEYRPDAVGGSNAADGSNAVSESAADDYAENEQQEIICNDVAK